MLSVSECSEIERDRNKAPYVPPTTGLTFDKALVAMREGKKVHKASWQNVNAFIFIDADDKIYIRNSDTCVEWLPQSTDGLLANDWEIYNSEDAKIRQERMDWVLRVLVAMRQELSINSGMSDPSSISFPFSTFKNKVIEFATRTK